MKMKYMRKILTLRTNASSSICSLQLAKMPRPKVSRKRKLSSSEDGDANKGENEEVKDRGSKEPLKKGKFEETESGCSLCGDQGDVKEADETSEVVKNGSNLGTGRKYPGAHVSAAGELVQLTVL